MKTDTKFWTSQFLVWFARLALMAAFVTGVVRCSSKKSDGSCSSSVPATMTGLYTSVFSQACINCHVPSKSAALAGNSNVDFSSQSAAYSTLVGTFVTGTTGSTTCSSVRLVNGSDPSTSYLAAVLLPQYNHTNFAGTSCTPYTEHLQSMNLCDSEKNALIAWIQSGAPNN